MAEEEEDSDLEVEEYSGMEQPPLIKQLKTILAEYPDDGQIIKELVQNAEDAEASEMKILYDGRRLNTERDRKLPYRKFFKAPALCFFNNEVFSEDDWRGIKMIYSSVKEEDPLKVGRFGLGFKSVFHITDNPCIISGNRILLMNPHERIPDKVCITIKLKDLRKCKRMKVDELLAALGDTFGFSNENLQSGTYMGTIFWFPLRESCADTVMIYSENKVSSDTVDRNKVLSDTCYDQSKVLDLFKSFQSEATRSLLFLKSLCRVELFCRGTSTEYDLPSGQPLFSVELQDLGKSKKEDRRQFLQNVKATCGKIPDDDIVCVAHPTFKTCYRTLHFSDCDEKQTSWLVINVFKGGKMSEKLKQLVGDKDLSYMPYVGAAVPMTENEKPVKGHVFCFLPLPQEKKSLTGLPIHFNGFFALSQNRRHLKWASADQETLHMHRDKAIEWNECLVNEVLPEVYIKLIEEMIRISVLENNTDQAVEAVYQCIPDDSAVDGKWEGCVKALYRKLSVTDFIFVPNHSKWVPPHQPLYTMFDKQNISLEQQNTVIELLNLHKNVECTKIPAHVWDILKKISSPRDISPAELCKIIKSENIYQQSINQSEKLRLLEYITKDKDIGLLQSLELLPLENGAFITFQNIASGALPVYFCTKEEVTLFPGLEDRFVSTSISKHLAEVMQQPASSGIYQIQTLTVGDTASLLQATIQKNFGNIEPIKLKLSTEKRFGTWLEKLWVYIYKVHPNNLSYFEKLPLIPCLVQGKWENGTWMDGEVHLYSMLHTLLVKSDRETEELSDKTCEALEKLSIKMLPSLPGWFDAGKISCVFNSNGPSLARMIERLYSRHSQCISSFNRTCKTTDAEALVVLFAKISSLLTNSTILFLQQLNLFNLKASSTDINFTLASVKESKNIVSHSFNLPVHFPEKMLVSTSHQSLLLAKKLGATEINEEQLVICVLKAMNSGSYNNEDVQIFMMWFLNHIYKFQSKPSILSLAREIAFVSNGLGRQKPSDLYDPRDTSLKSLFAGENKFPVQEFATEAHLNGLKNLGLRTKMSVTADSLYTTAKKLDQMCQVGQSRACTEQKAKALLHVLEERNDILSSYVSLTGSQLHRCILGLKCLPHKKERPDGYPIDLVWKGTEFTLCSPMELRSMVFSNTIGSVFPLIKFNSPNLGNYFNWNVQPEATLLTKQLENLISAYTSTNKSVLLPLVSYVYRAMGVKTAEVVNCPDFKSLLKGNCVWWGDGFCTPNQIILEKGRDDLDLRPYMYTIPTELEFLKTFFHKISCHQRQDVSVLIKVMDLVSAKHKTQKTTNENEVQKDLNLVLQILNRFFQDNLDPEKYGNGLLFPVHTGDDSILQLKPYTECTYCDAQWLKQLTEDDQDEEEIIYVHADVPSRVAEGLGVKSLKMQLMSDAEGLEEWGQEEPLTRRLHNILKEGYVDGLAVPKEIIQNADDARATTVHFLYDERENTDARTQLLDEGMAGCQGPALWAYNDALFSDGDLKNITKLSGATKESDTTKIGKFGLGFCAVYNLTDVPSFVSGQNMVIFDPHTTFLNKAIPGKSPGLKINLKTMKNKRLMKKMCNQFKPFQNVFGCDLSQKDPFYPGTLFRLPLRTQQQAAVSEIKGTSYSREEMLVLLKQFIEACGNMLLFTQNVKEIKVFHIPPSGISPETAELLITVSKECQSQALTNTVLDTCSELKTKKMLHSAPFTLIQKVKISVLCEEYIKLLSDVGPNTFETHWVVSWATGTAKALELSSYTNITGALPLGSIAILVASHTGCVSPQTLQNVTFGFYKTGHIFCYLPLPIQTKLEFHVNGSFAVTSNRRGLQTSTEDDKYSYDSKWNEALLSDTISRAFINLLVQMHQLKTMQFEMLSKDYKFYHFWPINSTQVTASFERGFYENIIQSESSVFESHGFWQGVSQCLFLNREMTQNSEIGTIARSVLHKFRSDSRLGVVSLPLTYMDALEASRGWKEKATIIDVEQFFMKYFLPHIGDSYWFETEEHIINRNKLLLYCLDHATSSIDTVLRETECIPASPNGRLRKPCELVYPESQVSKLFQDEDGRFPVKLFCTSAVLPKLLTLGMMKDTLPPELLLDRAMTIQKLASDGLHSQAYDRCKHLFTYLVSRQDLDLNTLQHLGNIEFMPVLKKPCHWPFIWHSEIQFDTQQGDEAIVFEKACKLFFDDCKNLVACTELLLNSSMLPNSRINHQLLVHMGVKAESHVTLEMVVEQLLTICSSRDVPKNDSQKVVEEAVLHEIYKYLNESDELDSEDFERILPRFINKPILLLEFELLPVSKVAFSVGYHCVPELYEIGKNKIGRYKCFLQRIGIKDHFDVKDVVDVLKRKRLEFDGVELPPNEFRLICQLLELLSDLMIRKNSWYQDIIDLGEENIVAPDLDTILRPTNTLCLDDIGFKEASRSMKFVHNHISRTVAERLGISTKRRKYMQDCSIGLPYEQKEELVTRLKGLLDGYPCDVGILKELIQNADDANATEVHFIKDFRTHSCEKIFDGSYEEFQGPALLVFNDSPFSQKDLKGLTSLGVGSKHSDPAKTGQYGVGFNAVYNLTDLPSFITKGPEIEGGETFCLLDPLQKFCEETCGLRCDMTKVRNAFPDIISGYNEEEVFTGRNIGTVFRLPLRQTTSKLAKNVTEGDLNTILKTLKSEMSGFLLFLRSITKVTVSNISSGQLIMEYSVSVELNKNDLAQRSSFSLHCKETAKKIKETKNCTVLSPPLEVTYQLQLCDSNNKKQNWIIVQRLGIDEHNMTEEVRKSFENGKLGMLPIGGVAVNISEKNLQRSVVSNLIEGFFHVGSEQPEGGQIYCFLPLQMKSGLPMHINGHFVLDHEARRSLWFEKEGYKSAWNFLLLSDTVAHSYVEALKQLKLIIFEGDNSKSYTIEDLATSMTHFSIYFPIMKTVNGKYEKELVKRIYETVISEQEQLFPICTPTHSVRTESIDKLETAYKIRSRWSSFQPQSHLFPGNWKIMDKPETVYKIRWSSFQPQGHHFPVYCTWFADINQSLYDLLKDLGLKLISLRTEVVDSMSDSECKIKYLDPDITVQFLKSYSTTYIDRIHIGPLPCHVSKTNFQNVQNVGRIMDFCNGSDTLKNELVGLPLLVTNDCVLRCFERNQKIYCTKFCNLFRQSAYKFVHKKLVCPVRRLNITEQTALKYEINIDELEELLMSEVDRLQYTLDDMIKFEPSSEVIGKKWIYDLWELLVHGFKTVCNDTESPNFEAYILPLQNWCLLPGFKGDEETVLARINGINTILDMESFMSFQSLNAILQKLQLPRVDRNCLPYEVFELIAPCLASSQNPVAFLVCLKYYRNVFQTTKLDACDSFAVLHFFSENIARMQEDNKAEVGWIRESLKLLPIFWSHDRRHVSVEDEDTKVIVLPSGMPHAGIGQWAASTRRILLQHQEALEKLYSFLEFSFSDTVQIYLKHLLPTWECLPLDATMEHLEYIRDILLTKGVGQQYDADQTKLIEVLKRLPVIPINNEMKKASEFFNPKNDIFRLFCRTEEFPPAQFQSEKWEPFLALIGMISDITCVKFIECAKQVSHEGLHSLNKEVKEKSTALVNFLMENKLNWDCEEYAEISHIKFVVPHQSPREFTEVHAPFTENQTLICFNGSISYRHEKLTWTSLPLLPPEADPRSFSFNFPDLECTKRKEVLLGIHQKPPLDSVVRHCQNVCDSLKNCLADTRQREELCTWLLPFMENVYHYLLQNALSSDLTKRRLYHTPMVFLPDRQTLIPAHQTVITLLPRQEIWPYLVSVPTIFGQFMDLFTYLGAADRPSYIIYVDVLSHIKRKVADRILGNEHMSEWLAISGAIDNLFKEVSECTAVSDTPTDTVLFLPTRGKQLLDASSVIVSDNAHQEERIAGSVNLHYFIGFRELELRHKVTDFSLLPKKIRPKYLTQTTWEEIDMSDLTEEPESQDAVQLQHFFQSTEFIQGVLRLLKHARNRCSEIWSSEEEESIASQLQDVQVRCVTGLKTYLHLHQKRIESSVKAKMCYFHQLDGQWRIYFQKNTNQRKWRRCLLKFINRITRKGLKDTIIDAYSLIDMGNDPTGISLMLDEMKIDAYDIPQDILFSVFPPPGTYVPVKLHHLLNCEISEFGIHEYKCVAFELEDEMLYDDQEVSDAYSPVYIYVRIVQKCTSDDHSSIVTEKYEINTGHECIIVPAFKLYKFIPQSSGESRKELVNTEGAKPSVSTQTMTKEKYSVRFQLQEAWKLSEEADRRRVIGRLLRRWHPDKNLGNEAFCKDMFIYLRECIIKLENGRSLDEEDEVDGQNRAYPDFTSSQYYDFCERMSQRSHSHQGRTQDFYAGNGFNRTSGANCHYASSAIIYQDYGEAHRWYRQAKVDLRNAVDTIDTPGDPPAYNWICYMCHQASEKALKAAWFAKDANKVPRQSHDIRSIAVMLGNNSISECASKLAVMVGEHTKMRYPDQVQRREIPSTVFDRGQAENACKLARQILGLVEEEYLA